MCKMWGLGGPWFFSSSMEVVCRSHIPGVGLEGWEESEASGLVQVVLNEGAGQMSRGSQQPGEGVRGKDPERQS